MKDNTEFCKLTKHYRDYALLILIVSETDYKALLQLIVLETSYLSWDIIALIVPKIDYLSWHYTPNKSLFSHF